MSFLKNKTVSRFVLRRDIGKGKPAPSGRFFLRTYRGKIHLFRL